MVKLSVILSAFLFGWETKVDHVLTQMTSGQVAIVGHKNKTETNKQCYQQQQKRATTRRRSGIRRRGT